MKKNRWTTEELDLLKSVILKTQIKDAIYLFPNRKAPSIYAQANRIRKVFNIPNPVNYKRKIGFNNDDYFSIPNIENSYWAGFIAADGTINKERMTLCLSQKEDGVLEKFKLSIGYNGKITRIIKNNYKKPSHLNILQINSKKIVMDLEANFNIIPNKSLILRPPQQLNLMCSLAFIVGYIDGDGCIMLTKKKKALRLDIIGTRQMLEWIMEIVGIKFYLGRQKKCHENTFVGTASYNKAKKILKKLISIKELDSLRLARKWDKVKYF